MVYTELQVTDQPIPLIKSANKWPAELRKIDGCLPIGALVSYLGRVVRTSVYDLRSLSCAELAPKASVALE